MQGASASTTPAVPGLLSPGRPLSTIGLSVADSKDLRWIDEFGDDLTMSIATRDWEESVKILEKGQDLLKTVASNQSAKNLLEARIEQLKPSLISQLAHDLSSLELRKSQSTRLVSLLSRLKEADLARDTFLQARREVMMKRVRAIRCEGDTSIYVSELAIVCFSVIRHTSDWYMTAFKENRMASGTSWNRITLNGAVADMEMVSGFVTWAKEQIETFADMFRRQVYAPTTEEGVADECLRVVASHNRKVSNLLLVLSLGPVSLVGADLQETAPPRYGSRLHLSPVAPPPSPVILLLADVLASRVPVCRAYANAIPH